VLFFAHSITVSENWDVEYLGMPSDGISDVIKSCRDSLREAILVLLRTGISRELRSGRRTGS
jgi:hypothetical protein